MDIFLLIVVTICLSLYISRHSRRLDALERSFETLDRAVRSSLRSPDAAAQAAPPTPTADFAFAAYPPAVEKTPPTVQVEEPKPVMTQAAAGASIAPTERTFIPETAPAAASATAAEQQEQSRPRDGSDLERVIAGSWLNRIGILALLIATAFFLKYAFDNNWITPMARIAIGFLAGAGLLAFSQVLFKKGYGYFSEGVVALSSGVLYLSLFAGWNFYHLIPVPAAFAGMIVVTAVVLGISLARDSQRLAFLALVGGFVTPLLLNTGTDNEIGLFTYLAVLNAGLLWVAQVRNWRSLPVAFLFTLVYAWSWYDLYYDPSKLAPTAFFATLFYLEFAILPAVSARRTGTLANEQLPLVLTNATWFTFAATDMLYAHHRLTLVVLMLVLAAAHFIISRVCAHNEPPLARLVYEALTFTFIAIAIGVGLRGSWVAIGWSVQGAALVLAGLRGRSQILRMEGLLLFVVVVARLLKVSHDTGRFLFNPEFGTFAVVVTCIGFASYRAYRQADILAKGELVLYRAAGATANMLAIWALSRELWNLDVSHAVRGCALAVLWTVYASVLVLVGNMRRSALFQWQGIVLLAMAIACEGLNAALSSDQIIARQTPWMAMLWACAGAAFVWRGVFWQGRLARATGQLMLVVSTLWVLILGIPGGALLFNARFGTLVFIIACYGVAVACGRGERDQLSREEAMSYDALAVAINAIALWALSDEIVSIKSLGQEPMQLLLTVLWTAYAAVLMLLGLRRKSAFLRWQSLVLLGIVICKVFLFDLSVLPLGLRILSFLALGVVLMGVSFVYQRRLQTQRDKM